MMATANTHPPTHPSTKSLLSSGNDRGFVFRRRVNPGPIRQNSPQPPLDNTPHNKRSPQETTTKLEFPSPKRRHTVATNDKFEDLSVPLRTMPEPTPLIRRTRTKVQSPRSPSLKVNTGKRRRSAAPQKTPVRPRKSAGRRRSTFSMRGKRASSIAGGFKALPHERVLAADLYRHISPELPEPIRLRQLLAWCARRTEVADSWSEELPDAVCRMLREAVKESIDDVHAAFERGSIVTSWYHRPVDADTVGEETQVLLPHPENIANAAEKERLVARVAALKREHRQWVSELKRAGAVHAKALDGLPKPANELNGATYRAIDSVDWREAGDGAAGYIESLGAVEKEVAECDSAMKSATDDLEVLLDAFHLDMHRCEQVHAKSEEKMRGVSQDLAFAFAQRRAKAHAAGSSGRVAAQGEKAPDQTRDLLRTLSAVLSPN